MFRIQKLLLAEFREIYEPIIVENPFTQVTVSGGGLRQYHIGLTTSKLIFGCDDFELSSLDDVGYHVVDAEIETFQLVSVIPLQFLNIHFYRKKLRQIMQIVICGDESRPLYFEFGGHYYRNLYWNTWRERVSTLRLMQPHLFNISGVSPFSSTDVLPDDEVCKALIHSPPPSIVSHCTSCFSTY